MGTKAERRAAAALVAGYHEARLNELVAQVADAVDRHRAGELDAFEVDEVIHRYQRAARQLWMFCDQSGAQVELTAYTIRRMAADDVTVDWWDRGAGRRSPH
jgi:acetyl-CoA acetyltransferase